MAIADALERAAANRYAVLGACMRRVGHEDVAHVFEELAQEERRHVASVQHLAETWQPIGPAVGLGQWKLPATFEMEEAGPAALITPYKALSIAVRGEEQAFSFWAYVASEADNDVVRDQAETMARQELVHAAKLRHERRRAFHAGKETRAKPDADTQPDPATSRARLRVEEDETAAFLRTAADHVDALGEPEIGSILRGVADELSATNATQGSGALVGAAAATIKRAATVGPAGILFEAVGVLERLIEHCLEALGQSPESGIAEDLQHRCERATTAVGTLNACLYRLEPELRELARHAHSDRRAGGS